MRHMTVRDTSHSARVLTIPNLISIARLAGVPVFLWLVLGLRSQAGDWWAICLLAGAGASDGFDGKIARALNQQSSLGEVLDRPPTGCTSSRRSSRSPSGR